MHVIYEVREANNHKLTRFAVDTAKNAPLADKKLKTLNNRLEKNKALRDVIWSKVNFKLNGNSHALPPKEKAQYARLEFIKTIKCYERDLIDDKRVELYNPMNAESIEPEVIKKKSAPKKKPPVKKEDEQTTQPETSKTALAILKKAGLKESDVKGTGEDGLITVKDATNAAKEKEIKK